MISFDVLDRLADAFNPTVGLIALALAAAPLWRAQGRSSLGRFALLFALVLWVYALRYADRSLDPTNSWAVGYSTHTAFAVSVCAFNAAFLPRWRAIWLALLLGYLALMLYQGYHPWGDVLTTSLLVVPVCAYLLLGPPAGILARPRPGNTDSALPPSSTRPSE